MSGSDEPLFSAQLVLKAEDGSSILTAEGTLTSERIAQFAVPEERIAFVRAELEKRGFDVPQGDATTLSVVGTRARFEEAFGLEVDAVARGVAAHATKIPEPLSDYVADVSVTPKPELFP
jgi:hypothetical protein